MLSSKFKLKYGNKPNMNKFIENEVARFLANDRLTEANLKNLDSKIQKEVENRGKKDAILDDRKSQRSHSSVHSAGARSLRSRGGLSAAALNQLNNQNDQADARSRRSQSKKDVMSFRSS